MYGSFLSSSFGLIFEYVALRSRFGLPSIVFSIFRSFPFGIPFCCSGSVFVGVQVEELPLAAQLPIPPVKIMSLGSSSAVDPVFDPFKKSIMVLLRKDELPPSPG